MRNRFIAFAVAAAATLGFDQATKMWARATLKPMYPQVKTVITAIWEFRYSENPGAAFGMFRDQPIMQWVFAAIGAAVLVGAIIWLARADLDHPVRAAVEIGLVAGGAVGNMIDRVTFHRVTDFVVWKWHGHEWDTFNVADAALVVGIVLLIFDGGSSGARKKKAAVQG